MIIREATAEDVEALKALWIEFIDFHKSTDRFFSRTSDGHERFGEFALERIRDENWLVLVTVIDQQIIGHCLATIQEYPPVYIDTRYGYIQDIAVTEKYRRNGFGTNFIQNHTASRSKPGMVRRIQ